MAFLAFGAVLAALVDVMSWKNESQIQELETREENNSRQRGGDRRHLSTPEQRP